jgi:hypothetical protein
MRIEVVFLYSVFFTYTYIHIHMYVHVYICPCGNHVCVVYMFLYILGVTCACMYEYTLYTRVYVHVHIHTHTYTHMYIHIYIYVCMFAWFVGLGNLGSPCLCVCIWDEWSLDDFNIFVWLTENVEGTISLPTYIWYELFKYAFCASFFLGCSKRCTCLWCFIFHVLL